MKVCVEISLTTNPVYIYLALPNWKSSCTKFKAFDKLRRLPVEVLDYFDSWVYYGVNSDPCSNVHIDFNKNYRWRYTVDKVLCFQTGDIMNKKDMELLKKANQLVNDAIPLAQIKKRCGLSYKQLLRLSKSPEWKDTVIFRQGYKSSPIWIPRRCTQNMKEFVARNYGTGEDRLPAKHLAWLFGRSERTIYRWIAEQRNSK